ncbi:MAG: alpha/beta fold hydrolase [Chitinophagaceae bacterium]
MNKIFASFFVVLVFVVSTNSFAQSDSIVLRDISWDNASPAGSTELFISSANSLLAGFIYRANGSQKHPTLLLLHGYPGNERNLDIAQVVRAHGWNVIYFDYRGSWGSQGKFSFRNCVEDVINVVFFCKKYQDSLKIDTSNIVLFGHSMAGWICLKAIQQLPSVRKAFILSAWDIYNQYKRQLTGDELTAFNMNSDTLGKYFVLNGSLKDRFQPVLERDEYFDLEKNIDGLRGKQIIMLDEHERNKKIAEAIQKLNPPYFRYYVWQTDHGFTNKRVSLMNMVLSFLDR